MSNISPASRIFLVTSLSLSETFMFPLGWLCDMIIPDAAAFKAEPKISLISATVPVLPPEERCKTPNTRLNLFKYATKKCSCRCNVSIG